MVPKLLVTATGLSCWRKGVPMKLICDLSRSLISSGQPRLEPTRDTSVWGWCDRAKTETGKWDLITFAASPIAFLLCSTRIARGPSRMRLASLLAFGALTRSLRVFLRDGQISLDKT